MPGSIGKPTYLYKKRGKHLYIFLRLYWVDLLRGRWRGVSGLVVDQ